MAGHWIPLRECNCGEETDRPDGEDCDECAGTLRLFCENCGREDLKPVTRHGDLLCFLQHKTPSGNWCHNKDWKYLEAGVKKQNRVGSHLLDT